MAKTNEQYITQISPATTVKGELVVENDLRLAGRLEGNLRCTGDLVLEQTGVIEGDIDVAAASLAGTLKGKVKVSGKLTLENTARLEGDIDTKELVINEGAFFQGTCQMNAAAGSKGSGKSAASLEV